jgi:tetratricopeptide (TPR) repeat protein
LAEITDIFREMAGPVPPPRPAVLSNIPRSLVPRYFLGRSDALADINTALHRYQGRATIVAALHGLRGVGKTVLAAAYAELHQGDYNTIWWLRAQTDATLRSDLVALGARLGWVPADQHQELAVRAVLERLCREGDGVLLIYDNAIDAGSLCPYLPDAGSAHVLVTSNAPAWRSVAEVVEIRVWSTAVGADYLIVRTGRENERPAAEALSNSLGGLPLAHEQAAAYCERLGISLQEYHQRFQAAPSPLLDTERDAPAQYYDRRTVAKTFALAIKEAAKLHAAAEPLIEHAALLAPEPIPLFFFAEGRKNFAEPFASDLAEDGLDEAVAALRNFALVDREEIVDERDPSISTPVIRLHRLVREIAAAQLKDDVAREMALSGLLLALTATYPEQTYVDTSQWPRARRLDPIALVGVTDNEAVDLLPVAQLLNSLAEYRRGALGALDQARALLERALAIREKQLGPNHLDTALSLNNLATVLADQDNLAEARRLFERALAIRERQLGPDDPDTARSLNNLGSVLEAQGDLAGARPLIERALAIRERQLGPDHPETGRGLTNLANVLMKQGDLAGARPLAERALAIREKGLGPEHVDTARSVLLVALMLHDEGNLAKARSLLERVLSIREKQLGLNHLEVATALSHLAEVLKGQGNLAGARSLHERALEIREKQLGPEHIHTARSLSNLGVVLAQQGNHGRGRALINRSLMIHLKRLGPQHPDTVAIRKTLSQFR